MCRDYILTCIKCIHNHKYGNKWLLSPASVLRTTVPAVSIDWDGNFIVNTEALKKVVSPEAMVSYNGLDQIDNANDTNKESREE